MKEVNEGSKWKPLKLITHISHYKLYFTESKMPGTNTDARKEIDNGLK